VTIEPEIWTQEDFRLETKTPSRSDLEPEMVRIKGGCFQMGSPAAAVAEAAGAEFPNVAAWDLTQERQHRACIEDFAIAKYEVTRRQWAAVMPRIPHWQTHCPDCPVAGITWVEVQDYIQRLNFRSEKHYRLPTEAEWEYACRSGGKAQRYCGVGDPDSLAWYEENSGGKIHPVGRKKSNDVGLYDMSGNVREWTCSTYEGDYNGAELVCSSDATSSAVRRGGCFESDAWNLRSSSRYSGSRNGLDYYETGLRLAED